MLDCLCNYWKAVFYTHKVTKAFKLFVLKSSLIFEFFLGKKES